MQLKAFIKNQAEQKHISAQLVMQNYMLERLLERISVSRYKRNFILKGGFLISAIVGLDTRTTMDLDTTIKGIDLTHESLLYIFEEICEIQVDDDVKFHIERVEDIRETDDYPGIRVYLTALYEPIRTPLTVDVTTGDKITPREIEYRFKCLFDEKEIDVLAYNLETVLAEKLETILSRGEANTRPRDFYDVYILYLLRRDEVDPLILKQALNTTAKKRGSEWVLEESKELVEEIGANQDLKKRWDKYRKDFEYAKDITYKDIMNVIKIEVGIL